MIIQTNLQRSLGIVAAALLLPNLAVAASHPLDPLSAEEIRAATAALRADPRLTSSTGSFPSQWRTVRAASRRARDRAVSAR